MEGTILIILFCLLILGLGTLEKKFYKFWYKNDKDESKK
jgi:hypothetical protein